MAKRENTDLEKAVLWMVAGYIAGPAVLFLVAMIVFGLIALFT